MKNLLLTLFFLITITFSSKAQYVTIPDANLRTQMISTFPNCFNGSQMLDTSCSEVVNATWFQWNTDITNWDGLQYLRNLQSINATGISSFPPSQYLANTLTSVQITMAYGLTSLPALPASLLYLTLADSHLTTLPALPAGLRGLYLENNDVLASLPALPSSLTYLYCDDSPLLTSLPALNNSLDTLMCRANGLTSIPALPSSLTTLIYSENAAISALPALPAQLKYLDCHRNSISVLPTLPASIQYIDMSFNTLTSVPSLPASLQTLNVQNNQLTSIPSLPASLQNLDFSNNQVSTIPTLPGGLLTFNCGYNLINNLPASFPVGLKDLGCAGNQISVIPALPPTLDFLGCYGNLISSLPVLPSTLKRLECAYNQLTTLPALPDSLWMLSCASNQLTSFPAFPIYGSGNTINEPIFFCQGNNIVCLPVLPAYDISLYMDDKIECLANYRPYDGIYVFDILGNQIWYGMNNPYPLCSVINNVNHCAAYPVMSGHAYYDNNNNLTHDANEPYKANMRVDLSNGDFTFTDNNGYYQVTASTTGNYTITATPPNYYTAVPLQHSYTFNSYDTAVVGDFPLQATTIFDSLTLNVSTIHTFARPGFGFPYVIAYQNAGTTTLTPTIVFNYDNTRLSYDSSSNAAVINNGSSLTLNAAAMIPGQSADNFIAYFTVNPAAVIGDSIHINANTHAGTVTATRAIGTEIKGSWDPNDKEATPTLSPDQVANGDYIYYTIRFQNTGNDTAFNIVVTDTLNSILQPATLQMIKTSHPCITTVRGNTVSFEFINILLPDSNVNELKSHGYITFRIKPVSSVTLNTTITNKAAIYFDYNSPVITNTAVTTIAEPIVVPLKLVSFTVNKATGNNADAYWHTMNELSIKQYNLEVSTDGRNYINAAIENAKGNQDNIYAKTIAIPKSNIIYFRLKITGIDGDYNYSEVVILKNNQTIESFSFLHNPVTDMLNISLQDDALKNTTARIFTAQGILVKTVLLKDNVENVNIKSLSAGTYYLVTEKGSRQFVIIK